MNDDLVRRLRCYADVDAAVYHPWVYGEAADELERLNAENERLREALEGVIRIADRDCPEFRAARAALAEKGEK